MLDGSGHPGDERGDDFLEQIGLAAEMAVNGAFGSPRPLYDTVDTRARVPQFHEYLGGGFENRQAPSVAPRRCW